MMFQDQVAIGHAGDVVTDRAVVTDGASAASGLAADLAWVLEEVFEQLLKHADRALVGFVNDGVVVEVVVEVMAQFEVESLAAGAVANQRMPQAADIVRGLDLGFAHETFGRNDDIADLAIDEAADDVGSAAFVG